MLATEFRSQLPFWASFCETGPMWRRLIDGRQSMIDRGLWRRRAALTIAVLVTVSVIGTTTAVRAAEPPGVDTSVTSAVQALLDRRVAALAAGDEAAYMATVDPQATEAFRTGQQHGFQGLRSVPIEGLAFDPQPGAVGDLAPGLKLAQRYGADAAFLPQTAMTYRLSGSDDRDAADGLWLTYVEREGDWYVAADSDAEIVGFHTTHEVWDDGALAVQHTEHFLVLSGPEQMSRANELADIAERAVRIFEARWPHEWHDHLPLIVPSSSEQAASVVSPTSDVGRFVAFVSYAVTGAASSTPPRLYVQDASLAGQTVDQQVATMVHELTHAATSQLAGPLTPRWLHEGLAEWVRLGEPTTYAKGLETDERHLPDDAEFASDAMSRSYALSASAIAHLAAIGGKDLPYRLFAAIGAKGTDIGSPAYRLDNVFKETTGMSLAEFAADWSASP